MAHENKFVVKYKYLYVALQCGGGTTKRDLMI